MERLIKSGSGGPHAEALEEAVTESIKNIVLVMANAGYLVPPSSGKNEGEDARGGVQREMWEASKVRLERFLPRLLKEIFGEYGVATVARREAPRAAEEKAVAEKVDEEGSGPEKQNSQSAVESKAE